MTQNEKRAEWAQGAIDSFQDITGTDDEDAISDLLCDMMHLCDSNDGPDFLSEVARARGHYDYEIEADDNELD
jgi:hypothetical protein